MTAYKFDGMDEWAIRMGIIKKPIIHNAPTKPRLPRNIHYGDEYDKTAHLVKTFKCNGHEVKLWDSGNLTCNCMGWVMKRVGVRRECTHVRDIFSTLCHVKKPIKTPTLQHKLLSQVDDIVANVMRELKKGR